MLKSNIKLALVLISLLGTFDSSLTWAKPTTTSRRSQRSAQHDDATARVSCLANETLVGCECYSPWKACDGAYPEDATTCVAQNGYKGDGVFAEAICARLPKGTKQEIVSGGWSGTGDHQPSIASCTPDAPVLTGCSCHSNWYGCVGAKTETSNNTCIAYNGYNSGGFGVRAIAICTKLAVTPPRILTVTSQDSGKKDGAPAKATCPIGTSLTSCNCYSGVQGCDGARPMLDNEKSCTAFNGWKGEGVEAIARCVELHATGCTGFCGQESPDGCYCDKACVDYGDCCGNFAESCL